MHFSNNTGYASWRGPLLTADDVRDVVRGIDELGVLGECDAVLSGYQGAADSRARRSSRPSRWSGAQPGGDLLLRPGAGRRGARLLRRPGIPELMRDAVVPRAQVITPNQFELEFLTGRQVRTLADVVAAAAPRRPRPRDGPGDERGRRRPRAGGRWTWSSAPGSGPGA